MLAVEGLFSGIGAIYQTYAQLWDFKDQNGGSRAQANITWSPGNPEVAFDDINSYGNQTVELLSGQPGSIEALVTISFIVTPEDNDFTFRALLQTACCGQSPDYSGAGSVDFGNTARLGIVLPDGYRFTSESGELLSAVPLPAAAWLFLCALGGLAMVKRRKR